MIAARSRNIDLKDVLSYELSAVPSSIAYSDGSPKKTNKSVLLDVLENQIESESRLPDPSSHKTTAYLFDAMSVIQMIKSCGSSTFGNLALKYYEQFTRPLRQNDCRRIDIVFDRYNDVSIKNQERCKRGEAGHMQVIIQGPDTPIPKQWSKYISSSHNKTDLN